MRGRLKSRACSCRQRFLDLRGSAPRTPLGARPDESPVPNAAAGVCPGSLLDGSMQGLPVGGALAKGRVGGGGDGAVRRCARRPAGGRPRPDGARLLHARPDIARPGRGGCGRRSSGARRCASSWPRRRSRSPPCGSSSPSRHSWRGWPTASSAATRPRGRRRVRLRLAAADGRRADTGRDEPSAQGARAGGRGSRAASRRLGAVPAVEALRADRPGVGEGLRAESRGARGGAGRGTRARRPCRWRGSAASAGCAACSRSPRPCTRGAPRRRSSGSGLEVVAVPCVETRYDLETLDYPGDRRGRSAPSRTSAWASSCTRGAAGYAEIDARPDAALRARDEKSRRRGAGGSPFRRARREPGPRRDGYLPVNAVSSAVVPQVIFSVPLSPAPVRSIVNCSAGCGSLRGGERDVGDLRAVVLVERR